MAFPTTGILDNFNRSNEDPLSDGGKWSNGPFTGLLNHKVVSNQCLASVSAAGEANMYRSDQTYGPDSEAFVTVVTISPTNDDVMLFLRCQSPGTTGFDGYMVALDIASPSVTKIFRIDNEATTLLGAAITTAWANGDAVGAEAIGSTIAAYRKPSGGSWAQLGTRSDSTYGSAGNIGMYIEDVDFVTDDFGGGTVAGGPTPINATPTESFLPAEAFTGRHNFRAVISDNLEN
jgi:hypothetical protein